MPTQILILFLLFFSIVPNLGFFTFQAFAILTFTVISLLIFIFSKSKKSLHLKDSNPLWIFALLSFSALYYGGLYQNARSVVIGEYIFVGLIVFTYVYGHIMKRSKYLLLTIVTVYCFLAVWTLINSPHPTVDTFTLFKEAPLALLKGKNPYTIEFTQVYENISNYFPYLPFSLIITAPFVAFFSDPRLTTVLTTLLTAFFLKKIFLKRFDKITTTYLLFVFLFFPRSFFILEHMYLDPLIFFFFVLFVYLYEVKKDVLAFIALSLTFSFKIHIIFLMLPLLIRKNFVKRFLKPRNMIAFFVPFLLPLYFFLASPQQFLNTFIHLVPTSSIAYVGPVPLNLSFTNFISKTVTHYHPKTYLIGLFMFAILYLSFLKKSIPSYIKITAIFIVFQYFTYMSFFNHYFFATLLWFLAILVV